MRLSALSDSVLIARYIKGEESCFPELISRHKDKIYTYLFLLLHDRDMADDFFQDVMVKVIDTMKSGRYREDNKFRPWVMRIAHNVVIDHFRAQQRMRPVHSTEEFDVFSVIKCEDANREEQYVHEQIHEDMRRLVALLPYEQREVVLMRIYAKMPFKEIAWVLRVPMSTAIGRMRNSLIHLRKMMENKQMVLAA